MSPKQDQNLTSAVGPCTSVVVIDWKTKSFTATPSLLQSLFDSCDMGIKVAPINQTTVVKVKSANWEKVFYGNGSSSNNRYRFQTRIVSKSKDPNQVVVALCYWNISKDTVSNHNQANATTIDRFVWDIQLEKWFII